mgnify:CR=1 FL=1
MEFEAEVLGRFPSLRPAVEDHFRRNGDLIARIPDPLKPGKHGRHILSLVNEDKLRRILTRMLDEERFLGPHGIRSLSKWHLDHPYEFDVDGTAWWETRFEHGTVTHDGRADRSRRIDRLRRLQGAH